jgi:hypothetical protein
VGSKSVHAGTAMICTRTDRGSCAYADCPIGSVRSYVCKKIKVICELVTMIPGTYDTGGNSPCIIGGKLLVRLPAGRWPEC